eukprot:TRINITY_DN11811_c0_g1_i1.p2 TRINITY_DN11811_c0_g1~~TRINITY_DN11811_c0_g1_i1.p2  ORF type:complete len:505 (-),score=137.88 TRINITY_DN11811_c0_g1_i1:818-2332(-)
MNGVCFGALEPSVCFEIDSLKFIQPNVITHMSEGCLNNLDCLAFGTLTEYLVNEISVDLMSLLPTCAIEDIPSSAYAGFSPSQVAQMNGKEQCFWISGLQFDRFSFEALAALNTECIASLNTKKVFADISAKKLSVFHDKQCQAFGKGYFDSIGAPDSFKGFTKNCISNFSPNACMDMNVSLLNVLSDNQRNAFTAQCVQEWPLKMIKQLTIIDVNGLINGFVGLCADDSATKMLAVINHLPDLPKELSKDASDNLAGGKCWNALNDAMGRGVIQPSIHNSDSISSNLALFFADDIIGHQIFEQISTNELVGLREGHALHFTSDDISKIANTMSFDLSPNFYLGLNDERIAHLNATDLSTFESHFNFLSVGAIQYLTDSQLDELNNVAPILNLCYEQAILFTEKQLSGRSNLAKAIKNAISLGVVCPSYHYPLPGEEKEPTVPHLKSGNNFVMYLLVCIVSAVISATIAVLVTKRRLTSSVSQPEFSSIGNVDLLSQTDFKEML